MATTGVLTHSDLGVARLAHCPRLVGHVSIDALSNRRVERLFRTTTWDGMQAFVAELSLGSAGLPATATRDSRLAVSVFHTPQRQSRRCRRDQDRDAELEGRRGRWSHAWLNQAIHVQPLLSNRWY